jgi:hypothetical protein
MGEARVLMSAGLVERLRRQPYADVVRIVSVTLFDDALYQVHVRSPLLARGDQGQCEIVVDGDHVRFKKEADV